MRRFPYLEERRWQLRGDIYTNETMRDHVLGETDANQRLLARERNQDKRGELEEIEFVLNYFENLYRPWPQTAKVLFYVLTGVVTGLVIWNILLHF